MENFSSPLISASDGMISSTCSSEITVEENYMTA